jgi:CheY-like chemotaxis protein
MSDAPRTILLVEDNDDDVFVFERVLRKAAIENPLHIARHGQEAVDYLGGVGQYADRESFPLPFIIFLDLKLPYLSGFEVLRWIRSYSELAEIVVIVLTSSPEEKDHERAYGLGARSYLIKPPRPDMLLDLAKSLQSYWTTLGLTDPFQIVASHVAR